MRSSSPVVIPSVTAAWSSHSVTATIRPISRRPRQSSAVLIDMRHRLAHELSQPSSPKSSASFLAVAGRLSSRHSRSAVRSRSNDCMRYRMRTSHRSGRRKHPIILRLRTTPRLASTIALGLLLSLTAPCIHAAQSPPKHPLTGRQIADVYTDAAWLDRPTREQEEQPDRALALIRIKPGMIVADVGAGSGFMTMRLARLVSPGGKVYANDLQPSMLPLPEQKASAQHVANMEFVQGTDKDVRLPAAAIDVALLVDVYHEFWYPQEMLRTIRGALKPNR